MPFTPVSNGGLSFYVATLDSYVASPEANPEDIWNGAWHHVVGTYDRKSVRLYVDGVQVGTGTPANHAIGYSAFTAKDMFIGDYEAAQCENQANFAGSIDDVRIWNRALPRPRSPPGPRGIDPGGVFRPSPIGRWPSYPPRQAGGF